MAEDLYIYDPDKEDFVPNPDVTQREAYGEEQDILTGLISVDYDQINGYQAFTPGGNAPGTLYPPGTFYLVSQQRHIAQDGTIRVDVVVEVANDIPGKQYELRVSRQ